MLLKRNRIYAVLGMPNGAKMQLLTRRFSFPRLRPVGGAKALPPSVWKPLGRAITWAGLAALCRNDEPSE